MATKAKVNPEVLFQEGMTAFDAGDFKAATKLFTAATKQEPKNALYHFHRGAAYLKLGNDFEANNSFERSIDIDSTNAEAWYLRGQTYMIGLDFTRAVRDFSAAYELNKDDSRYLYALAVARKESRMLKQALVDFDLYFKTNPQTAESLSHYGWCLAFEGKAVESEAAFAQALSIDPNCSMAYYNRGTIQYKRQQLDEAYENLKVARRLYLAEGKKKAATDIYVWLHSMKSDAAMAKRMKHCAGMTLQQQLEVLAECGIHPAPGVPREALLGGYPTEQTIVNDPFLKLLGNLASDTRSEGRLSNQIVTFDAECIETQGDYVRIAESLSSICDGKLPLQNIIDTVNMQDEDLRQRGSASIQFELDGAKHKLRLKVENDYVDQKIFNKLGSLVKKRTNGEYCLCYLDLGGSSFAAVFTSEEKRKLFCEKTFLDLSVFDA